MNDGSVRHAWDDALTEVEREIIRRGGYGQTRGLGRRPAVVVVDAQVNYLGEDRSTLDQIERFPSGVGAVAWKALPSIRDLVDAAHANRVQVVYTVMCQSRIGALDRSEAIGFYANVKRDPGFMTDADPGQRVADQLAPRPELGDLILLKDQPSAFFGTAFASYCIKWGVDTVLLAGGSTSGCVRATAVDAASLNLRVAVVVDCVYDRIALSHKASLLDIWMKYGDLLDLTTALDYLRGVRKG